MLVLIMRAMGVMANLVIRNQDTLNKVVKKLYNASLWEFHSLRIFQLINAKKGNRVFRKKLLTSVIPNCFSCKAKYRLPNRSAKEALLHKENPQYNQQKTTQNNYITKWLNSCKNAKKLQQTDNNIYTLRLFFPICLIYKKLINIINIHLSK